MRARARSGARGASARPRRARNCKKMRCKITIFLFDPGYIRYSGMSIAFYVWLRAVYDYVLLQLKSSAVPEGYKSSVKKKEEELSCYL